LFKKNHFFAGLGLGIHLFVKILRPGVSKVTFSAKKKFQVKSLSSLLRLEVKSRLKSVEKAKT